MKKCFLCVASFLILGSCGMQSSQLVIKGSDTEVNLMALLAEAYWRENPNSRISVSGGGSGVGIVALLNGRADVANSSRPMNEKERALFREYGVACDTVIFAEDAIAIIVHADNSVDSLTLEQLGQIFSGQQRNWQPFNGKDELINIYGRPSNSGTHGWLQKKLGIKFSKHALEMNGNAQIIEAVKIDKNSIGYVSAGYVLKNGKQTDDGFKILRLALATGQPAYTPADKRAIEQEKYPLLRPLYQYIRRESLSQARAFLNFINTPRGEEILMANGYFPVKYDLSQR